MKYSMRSLMVAVLVGPPLIAGSYFWAMGAPAWQIFGLCLVAWFLLFGMIGVYSQRNADAKPGFGRSRGKCSFCRRPDLETGALAEGPNGVLICYSCVGLCKDLIENECRTRGVEPGNPDWYGKKQYLSNPAQCSSALPNPPKD
jgi:hypothetical protein